MSIRRHSAGSTRAATNSDVRNVDLIFQHCAPAGSETARNRMKMS
ncbi:hypothetical protein [Actinopolyspora mzabensis]|nr:hypothetical protein [Actinopolyspora mzabensis]